MKAKTNKKKKNIHTKQNKMKNNQINKKIYILSRKKNWYYFYFLFITDLLLNTIILNLCSSLKKDYAIHLFYFLFY